jgi:hypothetical protein
MTEQENKMEVKLSEVYQHGKTGRYETPICDAYMEVEGIEQRMLVYQSMHDSKIRVCPYGEFADRYKHVGTREEAPKIIPPIAEYPVEEVKPEKPEKVKKVK